MKDLPRRTITGLGFGVVVLLATFLPPQPFGVVLAVAGAIAMWELFRLRSAGIPALLQGVVLILGLLALWWLRFMMDFIGHPDLYVPLILIAILPTWAADVAAYVVGSAIGRRKIAPRLSPGKTWEGTIAGFIAAGAVAGAIAYVDYLGHPGFLYIVFDYEHFRWLPGATALVLSIGPVALAGDLLESWVKRRAAVKDSGTLFPGHGGMLDRIDSLLTVSLLIVAFYAPGCCMSPSGMIGP